MRPGTPQGVSKPPATPVLPVEGSSTGASPGSASSLWFGVPVLLGHGRHRRPGGHGLSHGPTRCLTSWQALVDGHLSLRGSHGRLGGGEPPPLFWRGSVSPKKPTAAGGTGNRWRALLPVSLHPIPPVLGDAEPRGGRQPAGPSRAAGRGGWRWHRLPKPRCCPSPPRPPSLGKRAGFAFDGHALRAPLWGRISI